VQLVGRTGQQNNGQRKQSESFHGIFTFPDWSFEQMKIVEINATKDMEHQRAWHQLIQAVTTLTAKGAIKWKLDMDDPRADLSLLLVEGDEDVSLRVFNTADADMDEHSSYDSSGEDVKKLFNEAFASASKTDTGS
jgi:hypothetical protein